jgi:hypothetical protein
MISAACSEPCSSQGVSSSFQEASPRRRQKVWRVWSVSVCRVCCSKVFLSRREYVSTESQLGDDRRM